MGGSGLSLVEVGWVVRGGVDMEGLTVLLVVPVFPVVPVVPGLAGLAGFLVVSAILPLPVYAFLRLTGGGESSGSDSKGSLFAILGFTRVGESSRFDFTVSLLGLPHLRVKARSSFPRCSMWFIFLVSQGPYWFIVMNDRTELLLCCS